jgi:trans-aconitate methyltransferase
MSPYLTNADAWQESWDRQQQSYLFDREHRFEAILDTVHAVIDTAAPKLLDLAGGTGSITLRALRRFPDVDATVVDIDPVLLAIAGASLRGRATIVSADLTTPDWLEALPHRRYDAVCTATALHWLPAAKIIEVYRQVHALLRPSGVFVNADHMPDDGLPTLTKRLMTRADEQREARYAAGAARSWDGWWEHVAADPVLGPLAERRREIYPTGHSAEFTPPTSWHLDALREAGFSEAGVVWRGGPDAAVAGVR